MFQHPSALAPQEGLVPLAHGKSVPKSSRAVALAIAAKGDLEIAARSLDEIRASLTRWADELTVEADNLHQTAVGVQAEAIRIAVTGLTVRAASERLEVVSHLVSDMAGAK